MFYLFLDTKKVYFSSNENGDVVRNPVCYKLCEINHKGKRMWLTGSCTQCGKL